MADAQAQPAPADGRHRRQMKNYLLDRRFQLKYAGYFVAIALVLSGALGGILWSTAKQLLAESRSNVDRGRDVVAEWRKVSQVVEMNIVNDPDYAGDPGLLQAFRDGDQKYTHNLETQQAALGRPLWKRERLLILTCGVVVVRRRGGGPARHLPRPGRQARR